MDKAFLRKYNIFSAGTQLTLYADFTGRAGRTSWAVKWGGGQQEDCRGVQRMFQVGTFVSFFVNHILHEMHSSRERKLH